jgi:hypothetical protein
MRSPEEARELIWQRTVDSIDAGRPAVLWDAIYPEFYLAYGYDIDTGEYLIQGPGADHVADGRVSWATLGGNSGQVWAVFPCPTPKRNTAAARELALRGAVTWHRWSNEADAQWMFGGEAWDVWISAIAEEELAHDSAQISLNHLVYAECRRHAADFLAAQGTEFAEAAEAYATVANELQTVCEAWPFPAAIPSLITRRSLAEHLTRARDAEGIAIRALEAALEREKLAHA